MLHEDKEGEDEHQRVVANVDAIEHGDVSNPAAEISKMKKSISDRNKVMWF